MKLLDFEELKPLKGIPGECEMDPVNRHQRRAAAALERKGLLPFDPMVGGWTVNEFCARWRMSRGLFYKLQRQGDGPRITKIGNLSRITPQDEEAWRCDPEAHNAGDCGMS